MDQSPVVRGGQPLSRVRWPLDAGRVNTTVKSGSVVVGTDGSLGGDAAVLWAADYAETRHRPLVLLCATRDIAERSFGLVRGLAAELDVEVRTPLTDARQA